MIFKGIVCKNFHALFAFLFRCKHVMKLKKRDLPWHHRLSMKNCRLVFMLKKQDILANINWLPHIELNIVLRSCDNNVAYYNLSVYHTAFYFTQIVGSVHSEKGSKPLLGWHPFICAFKVLVCTFKILIHTI